VRGRIDSLKTYAGSGLAQYKTLRGGERIERRAPRSIDSLHPEVFGRLKSHEHPEVYLAKLDKARIVGTDPLVLMQDYLALRESTFDLDQLEANPVLRGRLPRARRARGPHMLLVSPWCNAYFHWMLDTLPRASLLPLDELPDIPVIVPAELTRFQRESLALVGVDEARFRCYDHPHLLVDELYFPSLVGRTGNPPRWALEWLRSRLAPSVCSNPWRRLYLARRNARARRVVNEPDVVAVLTSHGFEVFEANGLSLAEQLSLFSEASLVVGPHGAGFANLFAARRATVVELFEPRYVNACYWALADAVGHEYWFLMCEPSGEDDLIVDLERLDATLAAAVERSG
jgi:capsular polysaccharide biosynthesis protein